MNYYFSPNYCIDYFFIENIPRADSFSQPSPVRPLTCRQPAPVIYVHLLSSVMLLLLGLCPRSFPFGAIRSSKLVLRFLNNDYLREVASLDLSPESPLYLSLGLAYEVASRLLKVKLATKYPSYLI